MAITAKFDADFTAFKDAVVSAEGTLKTFAGQTASLGTAIATSLASTEIRRFATDVKNVATEFITAFAEEEAAVSRLSTALRAQGAFTPELQQRYADLATEFQRTTRFSDDAITGVQALLVQVGGVLPGQMKGAVQAIADLAAGMGPQVGGLEGAALLVAKAFSSDGDALGRLKVILGDSISPTATMAEVMAALQSKFGGQAAADIQTTAGKLAQFGNTSNEVQEKVGALLVTVLTPLADFFSSMPSWVQTGVVGFGVIGAAVAPLILSVGALIPIIGTLATAFGVTGLGAAFSAIVPFLGPAGIITAGIIAWYQVFKNMDVFIWAAKASWDALTGTFKSSVTAITGAVQAIYEGVKGWLVDRFTSIVESIKAQVASVVGVFKGMYEAVVGHSYVPDMVDEIAAQMARLPAVMVAPAQEAAGQTMAALSQIGGVLASPGGGGAAASPFAFTGMGGSIQGGMSVAQKYGGGGFEYGNRIPISGAGGHLGYQYRPMPGAAFGGGGTTVNVNVSGVFDANAKQQLTAAVSEGLTRSVLQGRKVS
jgi:hypothetical protein